MHSGVIGGCMTTIVYRLIADDEENHYQESFFVRSTKQALRLFHDKEFSHQYQIISIMTG